MMSIDAFRLFYGLLCLSLCCVVLLPALTYVLTLPEGKGFSELWWVGEGHTAEKYPLSVVPQTDYRVFVGVENHMGYLHHYLVYVKLANQTQPLPDPSISAASPLSPLYEFRLFLQENATWESPVVYAFYNVTREADTLHVWGFSINDVDFNVDYVSSWDSENGGFYFQLFFELWHYDSTSQSFEFNNRFVKIWLKVTA